MMETEKMDVHETLEALLERIGITRSRLSLE